MPFFVIFAVFSVLEIMVFIDFCGEIGFFTTLLLMIGISALGLILVRYEGFNTLIRLQNAILTGQIPDREVFDAFCIALAGGLMILPGFLSDLAGFLLLLPPVKHRLHDYLQKRHKPGKPPNDPSVIEGEYETLDE